MCWVFLLLSIIIFFSFLLLFDVIELELVGQARPVRRHFVSISVYLFYLAFYARSWREYANFLFVQQVVVVVALKTCSKC